METEQRKIDRTTASHYIWGQDCDGWYLVQAPGLSVIEERMLPGTFEVRHFHSISLQFFYVLAGDLTLECGGKTFTLVPGEGLEIGPGTPHQVFNNSSADVRFLVVSQPPSHGDRTDV